MPENEKHLSPEGITGAEAESNPDPRSNYLLSILTSNPMMRRHLEGPNPPKPSLAEEHLKNLDAEALEVWTDYQALLREGYKLLNTTPLPDQNSSAVTNLLQRIIDWQNKVRTNTQNSKNAAVASFSNWLGNACAPHLTSIEHALATGTEITDIKQEIQNSGHL